MYDGGDCCVYDANIEQCTECECQYQGTCSAGFKPSFVANGHCNDEANNKECSYDGGDCCGPCINKDYCSECMCLGETVENLINNALIGNGICNDATNTEECFFDGFDCCGPNVITEMCSDCACHGNHLALYQNLNLSRLINHDSYSFLF